jgi:hypothetical protein
LSDRIRRHTPRGESPLQAGWNAKAEALAFLEARTRAKATATADPFGMTNKRTSNGKNENKSDNKSNSSEWQQLIATAKVNCVGKLSA